MTLFSLAPLASFPQGKPINDRAGRTYRVGFDRSSQIDHSFRFYVTNDYEAG